jgi:hypothetical protein
MKLAIKPLVVSTAALSLMFGVAQNAQAALITGITASTDMGSNGTNIINTVNGQGLPSNTPSLTGAHQTATEGNAWLGNQSTGNITFNLNGSYSLDGFSFWNWNNNNLVGIKDVTVQSSTNGTTWTTIAGAPNQFAIGPDNGPSNPQIVSFSPVTASFVRFVVSSNWGGSFAGFSEVQFHGTPVPEPSALLALLAFGLGGVSLRKRL